MPGSVGPASRSATQTQPRVQVIAPTHLGKTAIDALRARGIDARTATEADVTDDVVAWALETTPTASAAVELAQVCARAASYGRPVCLLAPPPTRGNSRAAIERAAGLAYLRVHGAALGHDVDVWLESVVALVRFGMPSGPRAAIVAPNGSWLEAQAIALVAEAELLGVRPPVLGRGGKGDDPTDVVLYDPSLGPVPSHLPGLHIPVIARGELGDDSPALFGARAALGAIEVLGDAAERIAVGIGPAPKAASAELAINSAMLERGFDRVRRTLGAGLRVGDHETKTLLYTYGVPVTRQGIAQTPSAAVKKVRELQLTWPIEIKPWGHDLPTEPEGCPVERNITSDALVRRAFSSVLAAAGRPLTTTATVSVIVREPPPQGRDLSVSLIKLPSLGWTVVVDAPGAPQVAAAPAPLRLVDAEMLARAMVASRASDPDPDRTGLANLLRRASHFAIDLDRKIVKLELPRVVVGGRGSRTVVADAWCELAGIDALPGRQI